MPQIGQAPGPDLADLRMHRAGVDGALRHRFGGALSALEIFRRIGRELGPAAGGAEVIGLALVIRLCFAVAGSTVMPQTGSMALPAVA